MDSVDVVLVDARLNGQLAYGTEQAAGIDLRACSVSIRGRDFAPIEEGMPFVLFPGEQCKVGSGVKLHIGSMFGDQVHEMLKEGVTAAGMLLPRSGLGTKHRIRLSNTVGLIDADYQGEIIMVLENGGADPFVFGALDRLAQLVVVPVFRAVFNMVAEFEETTERGAGGFGSTGCK